MRTKTFQTILGIFFAVYLLFHASPGQAATPTELAGNPLSEYPFFEYVKAINENAPVNVAIDPTRFPGIVGQTCDIYVVNAKNPAGWATDPTLVDVTPGGAQTENFGGATIQNNTFQVTLPSDLSADAGIGLGMGYDVVLDCDQDGVLGNDDYIDGLSLESGFYAVHDTTTAGPLPVTEAPLYQIDPAIGDIYDIPDDKLAEDVYYPSDIASMGQLPIIIISRGNGHKYHWYDHIGFHMASYGYIVMSHDNNTEPGVQTAATTTLGHTDAFIDQAEAGAIAGGALSGHLDTTRITWIGHSRGGEGVVIAYDRIFDGTHTPVNFNMSDIKLISSMLPTDFQKTNITEPHHVNYHLWTASGDSDVNGSAGTSCCQTFRIHDRALGYRQSTVVQGTGHGWFHAGHDVPLPDGTSNDAFTGPCSIGGDAATPRGERNDLTHLIQLGHFLPLIKHYVESNIPALDFLTRQYENFRPIGVPTGDPCIVVSHEYRNGAAVGNVMIDDYQTEPDLDTSSSGGNVDYDVEHIAEERLDDNNTNYNWVDTDPFNGAIQAVATDSSRGVVFDWTDQDRYYEWEIISGERDLTDNLYLSFRGAQGTQHPNTLAVLDDLTFTVTLRDSSNTSSSINIGAFGGGLEQPYQRSGGWHNEMETIRIRLTDFLNNGSGLLLNDVVAIRLDFGPSWGSSRDRIILDEMMLTNDELPYGLPMPLLRISETILDYREVELGFAFTKAIVIHNDGNADLDVSVELTTPAGDPMLDHWPEINETVTVTIAPFDPPLILPQVYEPQGLGAHTIQMLVTSNDPVTPTQPITLTGTGVNPVPIDTMLILDRSGSMQDPAGDRIKIEALRDAAMLYTDLLREDIGGGGFGDKLGFWKYNHQNSQYMALDFITQAKKDSIETTELSNAALTDNSRLRPTGSTGIGGAMQNGAAALGGPLADRKQVLVVLTDGKENETPYIENVLGPIETANPNLQLYSVGVGADIEPGKLQSITNMGAGGYHQVSGSLSGENLFDLETFYFKIFSNATGMDLVVDPTHVVNLLNPTPMVIDSAKIISSDRTANFLVLDDPVLRAFYTLEFISPTGQIIVPGTTIGGIPIQVASRHTYKIYRIVFPDIAQSAQYVGNWLLRLTPNGEWSRERIKKALAESNINHSSYINPYNGLVPIGFAAAVSSNYNLAVGVSANNYLPGAEVKLEGSLSDRGWPAVDGQINVKVTAPDDAVYSVTLYDDGTHGDVAANDGTWSNRFVQTKERGVYKFHFKSTGYNSRGELAPREATRYVTLKQPEFTPEDDGLCIPCWIQKLLILLAFLLLLWTLYCCCIRKRCD